jgi:hypothetical protein
MSVLFGILFPLMVSGGWFVVAGLWWLVSGGWFLALNQQPATSN